MYKIHNFWHSSLQRMYISTSFILPNHAMKNLKIRLKWCKCTTTNIFFIEPLPKGVFSLFIKIQTLFVHIKAFLKQVYVQKFSRDHVFVDRIKCVVNILYIQGATSHMCLYFRLSMSLHFQRSRFQIP